jgi:sterol desaturase/sphingolipid hydroxylase (fatty acid hydroxylase superfamily)
LSFASEPLIRLSAFVAVFLALVLWEAAAPWREARQGRLVRWPGNWGIYILDILLVRILFPLGGAGIALWAERRGIGLFNLWSLPAWFAGVLAFLALDCVIYWQHRIFHLVPALWRLHRMHHTDTELDVSSGFRFHPLEILLSMLIKTAAILALGAPALAVIAFEIALNATSLFNHSNIRVRAKLDSVLRLIVVTPAQHWIHHSTEHDETDSNFAFNLPWWDWLFGSYRAAPRKGYDGMVIGLDEFRDAGEQRLDRLVTQPFRDSAHSQ